MRASLREARTVFFDIDDTLYDYKASLASSLSRVRARRPDLFGELSDAGFCARYWQAFNAVPDETKTRLVFSDVDAYRRTIWSAVLEACGHAAEPKLADDIGLVWARDHYAGLVAFPGARETAASLASRGIRIGVITNGPPALQRAKLAALGFDKIADAELVFVSGEVGHHKPDARIFERALARARCDAHACVMIGDDATTDLHAKAIGFKTVHFTPCAKGSLDGHPYPPDASAATYEEVRAILGAE